jgi:uncharacterized protein YndB with AHSA1/START domain
MGQRVKHKFEFTFKAKDELLFSYLSSPYNLATWFADKVELIGDVFTFTWKGSTERAKISKSIFKKKIVFQWIDRDNGEDLTFQIDNEEVTQVTILSIFDYDEEDQFDEAQMWWENTLSKLRRNLGG